MPNSLSCRVHDASIGARLALAVGLPALAMIAFAVLLIAGQWGATSRMQRLNDLCAFATRIADLVHETQKERGMSAVFLNSGGQQLAARLPEQRRLTSERFALVRQAATALLLADYTDSVRDAVQAALTALAALDAERDDISARRITGTQLLRAAA